MEKDTAKPGITFTPHEVQSKFDRVLFAEKLIESMDHRHEGRNTWLLNYGLEKKAQEIRTNWEREHSGKQFRFDMETRSFFTNMDSTGVPSADRPAPTTAESLTHENFWNELTQLAPHALNRFCLYIDEYKARKNWKLMFHPGIKFHHLPVEFQVGVIFQYSFECVHNNQLFTPDTNIPTDMGEVVRLIRQWFISEENWVSSDEGKRELAAANQE